MNAAEPPITLPAYEIDVDPEKMKTMAAILADPNPIHFDTRATAALGLGDRPINQGPLNMGYVMTMLAGYAGGRDRIVRFRVRFLGNVYGGDRVRAEGELTAIRTDQESARVADCDVRLFVLDPAGGSPRPALAGTATIRLTAAEEA